jgi:hypothetical protein
MDWSFMYPVGCILWTIFALLLRRYLDTPRNQSKTICIDYNQPSPSGLFIDKRITVTDDHYINPAVCVITGEPAAERHKVIALRKFFSRFILMVDMPFSSSGWEIYKKNRPVSLLIYNTGSKYLNFWFFRYLWYAFYAILLFPFFAVVDLCMKKRNLISIKTKGVATISQVVITVEEKRTAEKTKEKEYTQCTAQ